MKIIYPTIFIIFLLMAAAGHSQDLDDILNEINTDPTPDYVFGTFKGTSIINGQSVEMPGVRDLNFRISHRFGELNLGLYDLFGLDHANTRFAFEYGLLENVGLMLGRSTFNKTYDGGIKWRMLRQQTGIKNIPLSITLYTSAFANSLKWDDPDRVNLFSSRMSYATQLLIARKFNQRFSLQLSPTFVHKNLVPTPEDQNNIFALGIGSRFKLTRKVSLNGEYFYLLPGKTAEDYVNCLSIGFDIETGGHVFQLQFSNSATMHESGFITETTGRWLNGDIHFGFNIIRTFPLTEKRKNIQ